MLQVVAAVVERDGLVLVCRRRADQSHPLEWEFPGGKVEPGETPAEALARELTEEIGLEGVRGRELTRYEFAYPGKSPIRLIFFRVTAFRGEPQNLIFEEMRWELPAALSGLGFVAGDLPFLRGFCNQAHLPPE